VRLNLYGLVIYLSCLVGYGVLGRRNKVINQKQLDRLILWLIPVCLVGARLYHVADTWWYYRQNLVEIFYIWQGGLGIFGALFLGGLVIWWYEKKFKITGKLFTLLAGVLPLVQGLGRVANLVNGEGYGLNGSPVWLYELVLDLVLFVVLSVLWKKKREDLVLPGYVLGYGLIRVVVEIFRTDTWVWGGVKVGQILGLGMVFWGLVRFFGLGRFSKK
jgi:phosphatidylglycerol---prolipoprotein diacylglyceryl transferase